MWQVVCVDQQTGAIRPADPLTFDDFLAAVAHLNANRWGYGPGIYFPALVK